MIGKLKITDYINRIHISKLKLLTSNRIYSLTRFAADLTQSHRQNRP